MIRVGGGGWVGIGVGGRAGAEAKRKARDGGVGGCTGGVWVLGIGWEVWVVSHMMAGVDIWERIREFRMPVDKVVVRAMVLGVVVWGVCGWGGVQRGESVPRPPSATEPATAPATGGAVLEALRVDSLWVGRFAAVRDVEGQQRVRGAFAYQQGILAFVRAAEGLPTGRRAALLSWGLGEGHEEVADVFSPAEEVRRAAAHRLGGVRGEAAGWLLGRLLEDDARSVRLTAMEAVADKQAKWATREVVDAVWKHAVQDNAYDAPAAQPVVRFRGRNLPPDHTMHYYRNQGEDAELAAEVLGELDKAVVVETVKGKLEELARGRWGRGGHFNDPNRRFQKLVERMDAEAVMPSLMKLALSKSAGGGNNSNFNGQAVFWTNRTWAIAAAVRMTGQSEDDYGLMEWNQGWGSGWVVTNGAAERKAADKLEAWWKENKGKYVKEAGTQPGAGTQGAVASATAPATGPATGPAVVEERIVLRAEAPVAEEAYAATVERGLKALHSERFDQREAGARLLRDVLRSRVIRLVGERVEQRRYVDKELNREMAIGAWVVRLADMGREGRAGAVAWMGEGENLDLALRVSSPVAKERAAAVLELGKVPGGFVDDLLADLLLDEDRAVYVAALEAVWDRKPTGRMVDAVWARAVGAGLEQLGRNNSRMIAVEFRGRVVQSWEYSGNGQGMADSAVATEVLTQWKSPEVAKLLVAALKERMAALKTNPYDNFWGQMNYYAPAKNFVALLKAYKPAGGAEAIASGLGDNPRNGYEREIRIGPGAEQGKGQAVKVFMSERTPALALGVLLLEIDAKDLGMRKLPRNQGEGYYFMSRENENWAVKQFKSLARMGKKGAAATQAIGAPPEVKKDGKKEEEKVKEEVEVEADLEVLGPEVIIDGPGVMVPGRIIVD